MHDNKLKKLTDTELRDKLEKVIERLDARYFGEDSGEIVRGYRNDDKTYKQLRQEIEDRKKRGRA
jgi:hypothetical protein